VFLPRQRSLARPFRFMTTVGFHGRKCPLPCKRRAFPEWSLLRQRSRLTGQFSGVTWSGAAEIPLSIRRPARSSSRKAYFVLPDRRMGLPSLACIAKLSSGHQSRLFRSMRRAILKFQSIGFLTVSIRHFQSRSPLRLILKGISPIALGRHLLARLVVCLNLQPSHASACWTDAQ